MFASDIRFKTEVTGFGNNLTDKISSEIVESDNVQFDEFVFEFSIVELGSSV